MGPSRNVDIVNYYVNQVQNGQRGGGSMASFGGARYQRGHGVGSIFGRIRKALPWFFQLLGKHALQTGVNAATDYLGGKPLVDSIGSRVFEGVKNTAREVAPTVVRGIKTAAREVFPQSGGGSKRRRKRPNCGGGKRRKIEPTDVFSRL